VAHVIGLNVAFFSVISCVVVDSAVFNCLVVPLLNRLPRFLTELEQKRMDLLRAGKLFGDHAQYMVCRLWDPRAVILPGDYIDDANKLAASYAEHRSAFSLDPKTFLVAFPLTEASCLFSPVSTAVAPSGDLGAKNYSCPFAEKVNVGGPVDPLVYLSPVFCQNDTIHYAQKLATLAMAWAGPPLPSAASAVSAASASAPSAAAAGLPRPAPAESVPAPGADYRLLFRDDIDLSVWGVHLKGLQGRVDATQFRNYVASRRQRKQAVGTFFEDIFEPLSRVSADDDKFFGAVEYYVRELMLTKDWRMVALRQHPTAYINYGSIYALPYIYSNGRAHTCFFKGKQCVFHEHPLSRFVVKKAITGACVQI
jgi:hypothetical protein